LVRSEMERSLGTLVESVVQRQVAQQVEQAVSQATETLRDSITAAVQDQVQQALAAQPAAGLDAQALRRDLPALLREGSVKQAILSVVASEVLERPTVLGELCGIRAFIRDEIRQAHQQLPSPATSDAAPANHAAQATFAPSSAAPEASSLTVAGSTAP
jgi:hypothetical protein